MYQIANRIDWEKFEKEFGEYYTEKMGNPLTNTIVSWTSLLETRV
ncbi:hypothetical protein LEP1GSC059_0240 [Leptospira noguchii serovar Panama str. CZ214]|uniref:Uncharacterized protein n=1 Tax=Leptospira noguchii serovar Panama str. CZ214 TaxID=1001595 RepID=T0FUS1_9LEPT|nr:hypothetical protein LEP1GSC059_0240 [Leptospira noguchii serovar Panama str. CZ214]